MAPGLTAGLFVGVHAFLPVGETGKFQSNVLTRPLRDPRYSDGLLERFRAQWVPVRVKKTRQNKNLELRF